MEAILAFEQVCAGYGKTNVLNGLSFEVRRGEIFGVIGPNGSGKTTMLNAITGLIHPSSGVIKLDGRSINNRTPDARCRMGIGRTYQSPRPFVRMSVYENVLVAAVYGAGLSERAGREPALDVLRFTGLYDRRNDIAGELGLLDRKRLEVARAIVARPKLLLLDEVAAGLVSSEVEEIMAIVARLKATGFTIVWIEHIIDTMLRATDTLMCVSEGRCAVLGSPVEVIHSSEVERLYLGSDTREKAHAAN